MDLPSTELWIGGAEGRSCTAIDTLVRPLGVDQRRRYPTPSAGEHGLGCNPPDWELLIRG